MIPASITPYAGGGVSTRLRAGPAPPFGNGTYAGNGFICLMLLGLEIRSRLRLRVEHVQRSICAVHEHNLFSTEPGQIGAQQLDVFFFINVPWN